ncbi:hypothetical protein [Pseudomonas sp. PNPG3]|uniref:hypothetical protein n=1 Tax=Pseudomonas sp. PNPG3 TaxID=2919497 RepID=UPI001FFC5FF3|nr:hypothetical protein [Pseudomonas sp. PNPG3]MCK2120816.1 hypothetical protein [Pseudomonas sp. PNPG3]
MEFEGVSYTGRDLRHQIFANMHRRRSQNLSFLLGYFVVFIFAFSAVLLVPPVQGILNKKELILAAELEGMKKIPELEKTLAKIEGQISLLNSGSVGARLDKLESLTSSQSFNAVQVRTLSQLNQELSSLKSYMFKDTREIVEFKEMQSNYSKLVSDQSSYATKEALSSQISNLQWALGLSLGFFGLLFTVLFGSWWFVGRRGQDQPVPTRPVRGANSGADNESGVAE